MTFPRDVGPDAETTRGPFDPESPSESDEGPITQADLWSQDPASMATPGRTDDGELGEDTDLTAAELELRLLEAGERRRKRFRRLGWELTQTLILAVLIFLLVRTVAQNFRVEGPSMEPGLHDGQYLLVNKAAYFKLDDLTRFIPFLDASDETFLFQGPQRGDVVVFRFPRDPDRDFIKRVIGVPGDRVRVEDGTVYVNDVPLEEDYVSQASGRDLEEEQVVPPGNYFVLGDNRPNSSDSRTWGFVPEENIIGKAVLSYWPLGDLGGVGNRSLDLGVVKVPLP